MSAAATVIARVKGTPITPNLALQGAKEEVVNTSLIPINHLHDIKKRSIGTITDMIATAIHRLAHLRHRHAIGGGVIQKRITEATAKRDTKRKKIESTDQRRSADMIGVDHRPILRLQHQFRRHHRELRN
jgi:hypothetical protein